MDVFNLVHHDDDGEETFPLVDLWFDLEEHMLEGDISNPFDLEQECNAIAKIVQDGRSRHAELPFLRRNGELDMGSKDNMSSDEDAVEDADDDNDWIIKHKHEGEEATAQPASAALP
ncbi:hypothetical protein TRAPUB_5889 [Trametes pubescens]|uniref:Uncharacterized protein n=1 Tax=Trametes pubescens TaxID=154538 RepID=A0A1M2V756_TRAPU|nr:hypothetical protein TRAPUB_5889 [Trametes pubescens]